MTAEEARSRFDNAVLGILDPIDEQLKEVEDTATAGDTQTPPARALGSALADLFAGCPLR